MHSKNWWLATFGVSIIIDISKTTKKGIDLSKDEGFKIVQIDKMAIRSDNNLVVGYSEIFGK